MAAPTYTELTKRQKLAIFLIVLGPEAAADVLRQFEDAEIEAICKEMTNFQVIDPQTQNEVIRDFASIIGVSRARTRRQATMRRSAST